MLKKIRISIIEKIENFIPNMKLKRKMKEIIHNIPFLVSKMREKESIKVLFVIPCLSKWKTESLYLKMVENPRFEPLIGVALMTLDYPSEAVFKYKQLTSYLDNKGYKYIEICSTSDFARLKPDIIFHQEAAGGGILKSLMFDNYTKCIYCYITYALFIPSEIKLINTPYHNICWKIFFESPLIIDYAKKRMDNHGRNTVFTGVPMTDQLLEAKESLPDPWKKSSRRKRVIWAPHHSIQKNDLLNSGTFLIYAEIMLQLADKYKNEIQWAFKPHPVLRSKLNTLWGSERTDKYYKRWAEMENTQLEEGDYVALFKYSDALIHDSFSFMVEYLYMNKPCMFLEKQERNGLNPFGQKCYEQYYKGHNTNDLEHFLECVIDGIDSRSAERLQFVKDYLLPPNGKTASENIINSILGKGGYD